MTDLEWQELVDASWYSPDNLSVLKVEYENLLRVNKEQCEKLKEYKDYSKSSEWTELAAFFAISGFTPEECKVAIMSFNPQTKKEASDFSKFFYTAFWQLIDYIVEIPGSPDASYAFNLAKERIASLKDLKGIR